MIEALTALVFKIRDRRKKDDGPVCHERRGRTRKAVNQRLCDSIDNLQSAVDRKEEELKR